MEPRLGVDFGRVIQGGPLAPGKADTAFLGGTMRDALASPPNEGAFEALEELVRLFGGRVWIISKCGERVQRRTLAWLDHHDVAGRTGLPRRNIRFCRKRAQKAVHCAELGITHMIDDRVGVHRALAGVVPHRYLFGPQDGPVPDGLPNPLSWPETVALVRADCRVR
ncbi:hypothetical protein DZF91_06305 [Actinomadura logoneensis]|uniref:Uncharacterized protein n=1 Tax=Actinomadura logoneensis TaxID=2293572 RepID=A0A372JRA9_9ACTN|nr:hypothetical protein [Actinomadura logoneensis]RFU42500.1 hypothetical protein DZF91_06305 [Actinomadura logoneensis]